MRAIFCAFFGVVFLLPSLNAAKAEIFVKPPAIESMVDFWESVYVGVSTDEGLLHDSDNLALVYETIEIDRDSSRSERKAQIGQRKKYWREVLLDLAAGTPPVGRPEKHIVEAFTKALGRAPTTEDYRLATQRLRFQQGQREKFKAGLVRSGAYDAEIRQILRIHRVPEELALLPHVESSFLIHVYSKSGAAGMWQFIPATGRRFLTINHTIDERLSPKASTFAAAKLLRANFEKLGSWPLAITAYNHGAAGMSRAKQKMGTDDIGVICLNYKGRNFGFASRNFYGQFLAARRVVLDYEAYFGPLKLATPMEVDKWILPYFVDAAGLSDYLNLSTQSLSSLNPSLAQSVWRADRWIPKGYELKLPAGTLKDDAQTWIASVPMNLRHAKQRRSLYHTVTVGETLTHIARTYGTTIDSLVALNGLANPNQIFPGQKLEMK